MRRREPVQPGTRFFVNSLGLRGVVTGYKLPMIKREPVQYLVRFEEEATPASLPERTGDRA